MNKIVYIAGYQRSGSTILHNLLAQADGFVGIGEATNIWVGRFKNDGQCSCGSEFSQCELWSKVVPSGFDGISTQEIESVLDKDKVMRTRHLPILLMPGLNSVYNKRINKQLSVLQKLYDSVFNSSGAGVIVDSSKSFFYGYLVSRLRNIDTYIIHLVRDPRDVQQSLIKRRDAGHPWFVNHKPTIDAMRWCLDNVLLTFTYWVTGQKIIRIRHEDFLSNPKKVCQSILSFIDESNAKLPFKDEKTVVIHETHGVSGNESRTRTGDLTIKDNASWRKSMKTVDKVLISIICFPFLFLYKYHHNNNG